MGRCPLLKSKGGAHRLKYNENCEIEMSVRELCNLAFRHGDLDGGGGADPDVLQAGAEMHRKVQQSRGAGYMSEVVLSHTDCYCGMYYNVNGRADGVFCGEDGLCAVEEIKTVSGGRAAGFAPNPVHMAQAKCYAYFLCERDGLSKIRVRLLYCNAEKTAQSDSGKIKENFKIHDCIFCVDELREFYFGLLEKVRAKAEYLAYHEKEMLSSIRDAHFPFGKLRAGQGELIEECYRACRSGKRLLVQAPTGIGKTVSTLYPAIKALGDGACNKVFYLTAKASTRREAFAAAKQIFDAGAKFKTVILWAKEQICKNPAAKLRASGERLSAFCNADDCELAAGYYDRVDGAIFELLSRRNGFSRSAVEETAAAYRICPYELSLDLSEFCDLIICDYNYVFDPSVYLRRYFSPEALRAPEPIFLIDEAHNLPDRARDMYSAGLNRSAFEQVYSHIDGRESTLNPLLEDIILHMRKLKTLCRDNLTKDAQGNEQGFWLSREPLDGFNEKIRLASLKITAWLHGHRKHPLSHELEALSVMLGRFVCILDCYDERFYTYVEISGGDTLVRLFCLDPSHAIDLCLRRAASSVMFSATLTPTDYFADILGSNDARILSLPSPFDSDNLCIAAIDSVSTRFEDREKSYKKIANLIAASVCAKVGNYIVYFPSYSYMEAVCAIFSKKYPNVPVMIQKKGMTHAEKDAFLDFFAAENGSEEGHGKMRVGFCVLGGSFSEGIDLPGNRLIGVIIVGVGLPGLSNERNIMREYYENKCERGYDYAYVFPGMNNVMQAAGRVIRRENDRGIVVLVDDRYSTPQYRSIFPPHWSHIKFVGNASSLAELMRRFWAKH